MPNFLVPAMVFLFHLATNFEVTENKGVEKLLDWFMKRL